MRERALALLKVLPPALAGILAVRWLWVAFHANPLGGVHAPSAPHWHPDDGSGAATNPPAISTPPKVVASKVVPTNSIATNSSGAPRTNGIKGGRTALVGTNPPSVASGETNGLSGTGATNGTNRSVALTAPPPGTPPDTMMGMPPGTMMVMPPGMMMGMPSGPMRMGGGGGREPGPISPLIQARIDKITQSELLAPVFHPPPMALLGIAGRDVFLRTPTGRATLIREMAEEDGVKLLRIGTNRVLIEQAGEKKELTIFEGLGGESLLPK